MPDLIKITNIRKVPLKTTTKTNIHKVAETTGFKKKLESVADDALFYMQEFIMTRAMNPQGNIEKNLKMEVKETTRGYSIGLGDIEHLNEEAPYWYTLNYGYTIHGTKYINNPLGYIQATLAYLDTRMTKTIKATKGFQTSKLPER